MRNVYKNTLVQPSQERYSRYMGRLEDLEQNLYDEDEEKIRRRIRRRVLFPRSSRKLPQVWAEKEGAVTAAQGKGKDWNRVFLKFFWGGIGVLAIVLGAVFVFLYLGTRGQEAELEIYSRGPIEAGELVTIPITFRNVSSTLLKEVELTIILPEGTLVEEGGSAKPAPSRIIRKIEDLSPGKEGSTEITAQFLGKEGEVEKVQASLVYRPENLRARFSSKSSKDFLISRVPLALTLEAPEMLSQSQEMKIIVRYNSSSPRPFGNMWLRMVYPPGFQFISSNPKSDPVTPAIWNIGSLNPGQEGSVEIKGRMTGEEGETKSFQGELGVFNPLTREWKTFRESSVGPKIALTPLSVTMLLNGTREIIISPGDSLRLILRYKNNTELPLRNITVRSALEGVLFDLQTLSINQGIFDQNSRAIVWSAATSPELQELAPGEAGELQFEVKTKSRPPVRGEADQNQTVRISTEIKPAFVPSEFTGTDLTGRDYLEAKVRTQVLFAGKSLFRSSPLRTSGPLPPKVGQKTIYTVLWEVRNFTNAVENIQIVGSLPPNVRWEESFSPQDARVTFDSATSEVRWNVGGIKAGIGVNAPALTLAFQISITPSIVDIGQPLTLVSESRLNGKDNFTQEEIRESLPELSTELREDTATQSSEWVVR